MPHLTNISSDPMRVIVDTREQEPWVFPGYLATVRREKLNAGDYALEGDDKFAVERKSLDDFVGSITDDIRWDRLQNELQRMTDAGFIARVIIVEGAYNDIFTGQYTGNMPAHRILARLYRLIMDGICVLFAGDAVMATGLACGLLMARREMIEKEKDESYSTTRRDRTRQGNTLSQDG